MKAAILYENNKELIIEDVDIPAITDNDILVKVKACGVCHTDLHYIDHGIRPFKSYPIILGHEASGVVVEKGKNINHLNINDRVLIPAVLTCGNCRFCKSAQENLCEYMIMPGNHINGAYAEYITVPAKDVKRLPANISFNEGALIADAFSTAYHAVYNRSGISKNQNTILFGAGGVGLSALLLLKNIGAKCIVADISDKKLELAKSFGADATVNIMNEDLISVVKKSFGKQIDCIFEIAGAANNLEIALKLAKPSTNIVIVGYMTEKSSIRAGKIMFYELNIIGSLGCCPSNITDIYNLLASNSININNLVSNSFSLVDINDALNLLRNNQALRSIIVFE